jgi:addiction module HigA family antidote
MSKENKSQFIPDYAVPPGETLLETIENIGMSQAELSERTGRPKKTINEIIKGKAAITTETALQFERVLGVPARFWNDLERNYQETLARIKERKSLQKQTDWLKNLPLNSLVKMGWIKKREDTVKQLQEVLNFFGIASPEQWESRWSNMCVSYRKSKAYSDDRYVIDTWMRMGELTVRDIPCKTFDSTKFRNALFGIRKLTFKLPDKFHEEVVQECAETGVAVAFIREIPKLRVSGATWWNGNKAVIQLSLRYKTDDQLWFSFFHEAGHILLHGKKDVFIENNDKDDKEVEADQFASELLIPSKRYKQFLQDGDYSKRAIYKFATELEISPGIVVGRLQHEGLLPFSHCNDLKRRLTWQKA